MSYGEYSFIFSYSVGTNLWLLNLWLSYRKHGIEQDSSKASVSSFSFSESDKESNVTKPPKPTKEDKASTLEEEYIPKYLGKFLESENWDWLVINLIIHT